MKNPNYIAIAVALICFVTFTWLLVSKNIESISYVALLSLLSIVCLVLPLQSRLRELDVKNLKLTLEKMENVKEEIYAKEESLQETAYLLADVIAANSAVAGMVGDEESSRYGKDLVKNRIERLGENLQIPQNRIEEIFKIEKALKEMQNYKGDEREEKWKEFKLILKEEASRKS